MKKRHVRIISLLLTLCMAFALAPAAAFADGGTMTYSEFLDAVVARNGTFDGKGVTVKWEPDEKVEVIHRIQNNNAQYQIFNTLTDVTISNVNFEYVPADIPQHSDGWSGLNNDYTADQIRNAEFQFLNAGSVTITNCTFEKIIVSPYGQANNTPADRTFTFTGCTISNVYNAYALKDIYPATATISNNTFKNCSGAIYFEGTLPRKALTISGNTFDTIDQYAAEGKENTRGVIQFSSACVFDANSSVTFSDSTIIGNTVADGLPVIRQLSNLGDVMLNGWTPGEALSVLVDGNKSLTLPGVPSGNGYTFLGWAAAADYGGPTDTTNKANFLAAGAQGTPGTTYYAVWEQTYTVTYTDGVEGEEVFADQVYPDLASGTQTPSFNGAPARSGYVFAGWTPALSATVTADATYTATWAEDANGDGIPDDSQKYTVTYTDGASGTAFADEVHAGILTGSATPAFAGGTPARSGYVFTGWTPEVAATVTADATYTATWAEDANGDGTPDANQKYTVTYTDGVDGEEVFADQVTADLLAGAPTPAFNGTPVRAGYTFKGWSPAVSETVTANAVYTAQWEKTPVSTGTVTPPASTGSTGTGATPQTGDESSLGLWLTLIAVSALGLAGTFVYSRKKAHRA